MKSIGKIWDDITELDNLKKAHAQAKRGKSHYKSVQAVNNNEDKYLKHLQQVLKSGNYRTSEYDVEERLCGEKMRILHKLPYFPDRIAHHAFLNLVAEDWTKRFIRDTFQSIKGRGTSDCRKRVQHSIQVEKPLLARKIDVVKYYPSLTHDITLNPKLYRIRDTKAQDFLFEIIQSIPFLALGNHPSQYIGNLAVSELDWLCKQKLKIRHYFRYCDDIVIMADTELELDIQTQFIEDWLTNVGLSCRYYDPINLKTNYLDFVGFRIKHDKILLRKSISDNFKRAIRTRNLPSLPSYYGWCKAANATNLYRNNLTKL